jgi:predicted RND superfamily exporter protein
MKAAKSPSRTDRLTLALADFVLHRPWITIAAVGLLIATAASGITRLEFSNNYRVFFSEQNPELLAFEEFQDTYTKNDNIMFVLQPAGGEVFTPSIAGAIEELTEEAWKIPYAIRVDSVSNFQHSWADGDDLTVEDLVSDSGSLTRADLDEKKRVALAEPLLRGNLISHDAGTTGVNVTLQYPEESLEEVPAAMGAARALAARIERDYPGLRVAISGVSALNNAFSEAGQSDAMTLIPLMFGVLILSTILVLRNAAGTAATLLVIALSAAGALGLAGYAGIRLTPISVMAPIIILTLAIADSIHILVTVRSLGARGMEKGAALRESLRVNFLPVFITSVTTIVGFLTLNFSDAPPYHDLGNITSMGVGFALVLSLTLLPAIMRVAPAGSSAAVRRRRLTDSIIERASDLVTSRHRLILAVMGSAVVLFMVLVPMIDLNDEFVKYFDHRVEFRRDTEFAIDNLNGIYVVEFSVPASAAEGISEPEYLVNLESFTDWLRSQPEVTHVYSYADIIKRLNKNMHGDDPDRYGIPEERELAAQYLLLYELSLPYGLDLNDRINIDKSATRVSASLGDLSTVEIRGFIQRAEGWLNDRAPDYMRTKPTGATVMFSYISERNIESMLNGNIFAVLIISAIILVAVRSFAMGALSLLANIVPILVTFGIWSLLVRQVGMAAATVSATSLGIVVDDTVHFLTKYVRARREEELDVPGAVRRTLETVGPAMISTTVILAAGFTVLAVSTFQMNSQLGLLTAMTIVIALVADLLLLPAVLMLADRRQGQEQEQEQEQEGRIHEKAIAQAY